MFHFLNSGIDLKRKWFEVGPNNINNFICDCCSEKLKGRSKEYIYAYHSDDKNPLSTLCAGCGINKSFRPLPDCDEKVKQNYGYQCLYCHEKERKMRVFERLEILKQTPLGRFQPVMDRLLTYINPTIQIVYCYK